MFEKFRKKDSENVKLLRFEKKVEIAKKMESLGFVAVLKVYGDKSDLNSYNFVYDEFPRIPKNLGVNKV